MFEDNDKFLVSRRQLILGAVGLGATALIPARAALAFAPDATKALGKAPRSLSFVHLHTDETLTVTYWERGHYIRGALAEINHLLRDFRTETVKPIDRALLNQLCLLHRTLGSSAPFEIFSAYRSPITNTVLRHTTSGVAKGSLHLQGKAIDIRVGDRSLEDVRTAALSLGAGGVGYYPDSDFVHLDTGRVRSW